MAHGNISSTGRISGGGGEGSNHYLVTIQLDLDDNRTYPATCRLIHSIPIDGIYRLFLEIEGGRDVYGVTPSLLVDGFYYISATDRYATNMYFTYVDEEVTSPGYFTRRYYLRVSNGGTLINKYIGQIVFEDNHSVSIQYVEVNFKNVKI